VAASGYTARAQALCPRPPRLGRAATTVPARRLSNLFKRRWLVSAYYWPYRTNLGLVPCYASAMLTSVALVARYLTSQDPFTPSTRIRMAYRTIYNLTTPSPDLSILKNQSRTLPPDFTHGRLWTRTPSTLSANSTVVEDTDTLLSRCILLAL
jgi:hypothetical protein